MLTFLSIFESTVEKAENAGSQHFLLFTTMFSTLIKEKFHHVSHTEIAIYTYF